MYPHILGGAMQVLVSNANTQQIVVNMEHRGFARMELQRRLADKGLDPGRAAGYLCGCLIRGGMRYAYKQHSGSKTFSGINRVIAWEMKMSCSAHHDLQVRIFCLDAFIFCLSSDSLSSYTCISVR